MVTLLKKHKKPISNKQYNAVVVGDFSGGLDNGRIASQNVGGQFIISVGMPRKSDNIDKYIHSACVDIAKVATAKMCKSVLIDTGTFCNKTIGLSQIVNLFLGELCESSDYDGLSVVVAVDFVGKGLSTSKKKKLEAKCPSRESVTVSDQGNANYSSELVVTEMLLSYGDKDGTSVKERFKEYQEESADNVNFKDYLLNLIKKKRIKKFSSLYNAAGITKDTFSKILDHSKTRKPSKETIAALTIGLKLNLQEAQEFYNMAGYSLTSWDYIDILIRFCINEKIYDIDVVNSIYFDETGRLLGSNVRKDSTVQF